MCAQFAEKKEREEKMAALQQRADGEHIAAFAGICWVLCVSLLLTAFFAAGDVKAKSELRRMQMEDPAKEAKDEASALHAKLAAKRALANPEGE